MTSTHGPSRTTSHSRKILHLFPLASEVHKSKLWLLKYLCPHLGTYILQILRSHFVLLIDVFTLFFFIVWTVTDCISVAFGCFLLFLTGQDWKAVLAFYELETQFIAARFCSIAVLMLYSALFKHVQTVKFIPIIPTRTSSYHPLSSWATNSHRLDCCFHAV